MPAGRPWAGQAAAAVLLALAAFWGRTGQAGTNEPAIAWLRAVDGAHDWLSGLVTAGADRLDRHADELLTPEAREHSEVLDRFFGDRRIPGGAQRSRLDITTELQVREGVGLEPGVEVDAVINLPRTQRRVQFILRSFEEEDQVLDELLRRRTAVPEEEPEPEDQGEAGLRVTVIERGKFSTDFDFGMRLDPEPEPKFRLRGTLHFPVGVWRWSAYETLFWEKDDGFGLKTGFDMARALGERTAVRSYSSALISEAADGVELGQTFVLSRLLGPERAVAVKAAVQAETGADPPVRRYLLRVNYRTLLYDDWLYLVVEPGADLPEERSYDFVPLVTFAVEARFGRMP